MSDTPARIYCKPSHRPPCEATTATGQRPKWVRANGGAGLDRFVGLNEQGPLWAISPDAYGDWVRVGMALHAETNGGADGLALWDSWSAQSPKWSPGVCTSRWGSFGGRKGITGGTIYGMAEERGWSRPLRSMDHRARAPHVVQRIHSATQAPPAAPAQTEPNASPPPAASANEVKLADFYAHMPSGDFIFIPGRDFWPARSVDARIPPVTMSAAEDEPVTIKASRWIAKYRPVEQMTWAPGRPELIEDGLVTEGGFILSRAAGSSISIGRPRPSWGTLNRWANGWSISSGFIRTTGVMSSTGWRIACSEPVRKSTTHSFWEERQGSARTLCSIPSCRRSAPGT